MQGKKTFTRERMYPINEVCKDCGAEFQISVKEQLFAKEDKGFNLPKRCPCCRNERKNRTKQIVCVECGEVFEMSAGEQDFYAQKGFAEPKRCPSCRKKTRGSANGQNIAEENQ